MNTDAEKRLSRARVPSVEIDDPVWFPPLTELALALPRRVAHTIRVMIHPGSTQPGHDGIVVSPMSEDWIQQSGAEASKHGDIY
jgi:hypothetical protein